MFKIKSPWGFGKIKDLRKMHFKSIFLTKDPSLWYNEEDKDKIEEGKIIHGIKACKSVKIWKWLVDGQPGPVCDSNRPGSLASLPNVSLPYFRVSFFEYYFNRFVSSVFGDCR